MKKFIISIDAGTTSNRSILFDLKGKPVFSSQKEFTQYFPKSGWVEHNPEEIWRTTLKTLKDVIQKANRLGGQILSIGITQSLTKEEKQWIDIFTQAKQRLDELKEREINLTKDLTNLRSMPKTITSEKIRLQKLIEENKISYDKIANQLQETERSANEINKKLKLEEVKLNEFREEKIRIEGSIATINEAIKQLSTQVKERLNANLNELFNIAELNPNRKLGEIKRLKL